MTTKQSANAGKPAIYANPMQLPEGMKRPKWYRTVFFTGGKAFLSPEPTGMSEGAAFLLCARDGVECLQMDGHIYVEHQWLRPHHQRAGRDPVALDGFIARARAGICTWLIKNNQPEEARVYGAAGQG